MRLVMVSIVSSSLAAWRLFYGSTIIQVFDLDAGIKIRDRDGLVLKDGVCQKLKGTVALGVRSLIDEKLDDPLPEKGRVRVCHVEAHHLDLAGKARVLHRLGRTGQTGAADEDAGQFRQLGQLIPGQPVDQVVVTATVNDGETSMGACWLRK